MLSRIFQLPLIGLAHCIRLVNVNRVWIEPIEIGESEINRSVGELVHKRRNWYGWILILPGNQVFRLRSPRLQVLYNQQWLDWERLVKESVRGEFVSSEGSAELICDRIPGQSVADLLESQPTLHRDEKLRLFATVTMALAQFHSFTVDTNQLGSVKLSHGDASIHNVLFDAATEAAEWFDFDLRHDLREPFERRQADDLRALIYSAAHFFRSDEVDGFVNLVRQTYDDPSIWQTLQQQVSNPWFPFDIFHLSQVRRARAGANFSSQRDREYDQVIRSAISTPTSDPYGVKPEGTCEK